MGFSGDAAEKPCGVLSGGEKIRLAFARIYADPPNLLLLDEPTTHLDLNGRRALESALHNYTGTVCLVSHDVEFVRATATSILELSPAGLKKFAGNYDYYRERISTEQPALTQTPGEEAPRADQPRMNQKEQRRQRAEERKKRQPRIRQLRRRLEAAEKRSAELEEEQTGLIARLSETTPDAGFEDLNRRMTQLQADLKMTNHLWEQAAMELEEFGETT